MDDENGALSWFALDFDSSVVGFHYLFALIETDTESFAFCSHKGPE